jgi:hypothetical protein
LLAIATIIIKTGSRNPGATPARQNREKFAKELENKWEIVGNKREKGGKE